MVVTGPQLTFSTKIVAPLLKSRMLSSQELVTLSCTSRALLMSVNVQDAAYLIVPLDVTRPEAIEYLDHYFALKSFSVVPSSPNKRRSTMFRKKSSAGQLDADAGKAGKQRMTAWRFATCRVKGDAALTAFCQMLSSESPGSMGVRSMVQTLIVSDANVALAKLSPMARSLRALHLLQCSTTDDVPALPLLRELVVEDPRGGSAITKSLLANVPKLEMVRVRCSDAVGDGALVALGELKSLALAGSCVARGALPRLADSTKLREIVLTDVPADVAAESLPGFVDHALKSSPSALRTLALHRAGFQALPAFAPNASLTKLTLAECASLESLAGAEAFSKLEELALTKCSSLLEAGGLSSLAALTRIDLSGCEQLINIASLQSCAQLRWLDISGTGLDESALACLAQCDKLETLRMSGCALVTSLVGVCGPRLRRLVARKCASLTTAPCNAPALEYVDLSGCVWVTSLSGIDSCPRLATLLVPNCGRLKSLAPLEQCTLLTELDCTLSTVEGLASVVAQCRALKDLQANAHDGVQSLATCMGDGSTKSTSLRTLHMSAWKQLGDAYALKAFASCLETLDLSGSRLVDCTALAVLGALRYLKLTSCRKLTNVAALTDCSSLIGVDLSSNPVLEDVSALGRLPKLLWVNLCSCEKLSVLKGIDDNGLRRIELFGSEASVFHNYDSVRALFSMEFVKHLAVLYAREEAEQWGGQSYQVIRAEFVQPAAEEEKKSAGCVVS